MVTAQFGSYFVAMASAGAALIGLLFVAISINPERTFGRAAIAERQAVASSTFTALANAFFISAAGLLPGTDTLGPTALALGSVALLNTIWLAMRLVPQVYRRGREVHRRSGRIMQSWRAFFSLLIMLGGGLFVYGAEMVNALNLIRTPHAIGPVFVLATLLLVVYGIALIRAWELLGAPRSGISGWLNPLAGLEADEPPAVPASDTVRTTPAPSEIASAKDAAPHSPA